MNRKFWNLAIFQHGQSSRYLSTFKSENLRYKPSKIRQPKAKPNTQNLPLGTPFTDHMLRIKWTESKGWQTPIICQLQNLEMYQAVKASHYSQELFESMKAYRGVDNNVRLFRPMLNMTRMAMSARRSCLPEFEPAELLSCIAQLVHMDQEWVPHDSSLYIRSTLVGWDSASQAELFVLMSRVKSSSVKPINLLAEPQHLKVWPGGSGFNPEEPRMAFQQKCQQAISLYGPDEEISSSSMNVFALFKHPDGRTELVTPSLYSGLIWPGVMRRSVIELTRNWNKFEVNERRLTIKEVLNSAENGTLIEMFGTGTVATVSPIANIFYNGKMRAIPVPDASLARKLSTALSDIYYGKVNPHPWTIDINELQPSAYHESNICNVMSGV